MSPAELLLVAAIPVFVVSMAIEVAVVGRGGTAVVGYERRDTLTSLAMGAGSLVVGAAWKLAEFALLTALFAASPFDLGTGWPTWVALVVAVDFAYYWEHRMGHEVRLLWASHVVHHSSRHYNLSTALRQTWTGFHHVVFLGPLALLGFRPWMILVVFAANLVYQFGIHTETIDRLPRPVEFVFNTPSHHRAHHGTNPEYLDRNYGGILIVWDRLFATFEPEVARVDYGLTRNIDTFNPLRVATHEYAAIARDVRRSTKWRARLGHVLRGPGWQPVA